MENNNKCCIGILKWQLFWEKEKLIKRQLLWDVGSRYQVAQETRILKQLIFLWKLKKY